MKKQSLSTFNFSEALKRFGLGLFNFSKIVCFLTILSIVLLNVYQRLLPKISPYYAENEWDVVFFGTSQSYCTFDPAIFDEYGMKTYNRGRAQQPIEYTYYYVKDALEVGHIDTVVLEIFGLIYGADSDVHDSTVIRDSSLNDFRFSDVRKELVADILPEEQQENPLYLMSKYHTTWETWDYSSWDNFRESMEYPYTHENTDRGFVGYTVTSAFGYASWDTILTEDRLSIWEENMRYLDGIYDLCEQHGARLVLVKAPFPCYLEAVALTNTVGDWAEVHDVELVNYMQLTDQIGLDFSSDSIDSGVHLNKDGADKVSRHLAEYLLENSKEEAKECYSY